MNSKVKKFVASIAVNMCKISAESVSVSACLGGAFQPKEPKCLKKEN